MKNWTNGFYIGLSAVSVFLVGLIVGLNLADVLNNLKDDEYARWNE